MLAGLFDGGAAGLPDFDSLNYFNQDIVIFLAACVCLIMGILICFWGYKYLLTLFCIVCGCAAGAVGMHWLDGRIEYPLINLFMLASFIFLGECALYGISSMLNHAMKQTGFIEGVTRLMILVSPLFGAALIFAVLYFYVSTNVILDGAFAAVILVVGAVNQYRSKANRRTFHTYDDIYNEVRRDA